MPGTFSKAARPKRPGSYVNFEAIASTTVPAAIGSTVAIGFTHDYGPEEATVTLRSLADFKAIFGPSENTPGFGAVKQAFQGEGLDGRGGAGAVVAFRMVGASGAKATKALQNTTPAVALTLSAKYAGSFGNNLTVTTQVNAANPASTDLIVYVQGVEVERYTFTSTATATARDAINANSKWVTAVMGVAGVALASVTASAFATGDSGSTLLAADYTIAMTAFEHERFGVVCFENLTDTSITASLKTWGEGQNTNGKRFMTVLGGLPDELIATAVTRAQTAGSENIVTLGMGSVSDAQLGTLGSAQLAPRVAGILAAKGEAQSMTFARLAGVSIINSASEAEILTAFDAGVMVLSRDSNPDAPVRIEKALTTYTGTTAPQKPYLIFRNPKYVRTMQGFQMELADYADANVIGRAVVNDKTRDFLVGEGRVRAQKRVELGVIQPGFTVKVDPDPAPSDSDDFIALVIGMAFGRSVEQVFWTIRVS